MAKEEKPLEYEGRERETKSIAQRIDLSYLKRPAMIALLRRRAAWIAVALSIAAGIPLVMGIAGSKKALQSGPVSPAHALFGARCEVCHARAFSSIPDSACKTCHDGPAHPALSFDTGRPETTIRCAQCHVEHRGAASLKSVAIGNCTRCHADLKSHAQNVHIAGVEITAFRPGKHPEFAALSRPDLRPIKLHHAIHLPAQPKTIRGLKLPMQCVDCHRTDPNSATGDPIPVTFEQNCRSCHARELEFDVYNVLGDHAMPAPHTRDAEAIRRVVTDTYRQALAADPSIARRPLGTEVNAQPSPAAWLDRVVRDSESYLFERKCTYCHEPSGNADIVQKVGKIQGRFGDGPWFQRGQFSHRAHRAVECESCHTAARTSTKTTDVLVPAMKNCTPCHESGSAGLDRCSTCHLYHNKSLEKDNRRPTPSILGGTQ